MRFNLAFKGLIKLLTELCLTVFYLYFIAGKYNMLRKLLVV
jgi:hypothetical protein